MNLNELIFNALKPLGIPVSRARYNQTANTYIVFMEYNQTSRMNADDEEIITKHFYQVDVFSKTDYDDLVKQVRKELEKVGFKRMFQSETFDEEMGMYRAILRFNFENTIRSDI